MLVSNDRVLSIVDAARLIFRTGSPNDAEIYRVYQQMKSGALKVRDSRGPPLKWTTTEAWLAEFFADNQVASAKAHQVHEAAARRLRDAADAQRLANPAHDGRETKKLRDAYRAICRDYFLAVLLRRRMERRSKVFHRLVVVGQVVVLSALVATIIGGVRLVSMAAPPEQRIVERWIAEHTDEHQVMRWEPLEPARNGKGTIVRVEYRYCKDSHRAIYTNRSFLVCGETVEEFEE